MSNVGKETEETSEERLPAAGGDGSRAAEPDGARIPAGPAVTAERGSWPKVAKAVSFLAALFLFVLAIQLMKEGAQAIAPRLQGSGLVDNGVSTLGLGWLAAYVVLSGSPVAVMGLSLHAAGGLTELQTFTMISGSRLGASFIVLLVGFLYAVRASNRRDSLGMGVLALSISTIIYLPAMALGYGILKSGALDGVRWTVSSDIQSVIDAGWGWAQAAFSSWLPPPLLFAAGLGVILVSFKLLDRVLPAIDGEKHADSRRHWLTKPWSMFFLGCIACLLTLSVSVAITVLVPLAARGYVDRREAIPYIMGANITTLADTLFAAMLLPDGGSSVHVVLALALAVAVVTLLALALAYRPLQRGIMALDDWVVGTSARLWLFVGALFLVPVGLLLVGGAIGPVGP
jgi:solute carrier family 34 (sodium-dependent phosphate cotransporter)